jgi:hypothetical protein
MRRTVVFIPKIITVITSIASLASGLNSKAYGLSATLGDLAANRLTCKMPLAYYLGK